MKLSHEQQYENSLMSTFRGGQELRKRNGLLPVVDGDLAPPGPANHYEKPREFRYDLDKHQDRLETDERLTKLRDRWLVAGKILGTVTLLRAEGGEDIEFNPLIEGSLGFTPYMVPEKNIQALTSDLKAILRENSKKDKNFSGTVYFTGKSRDNYYERYAITKPGVHRKILQERLASSHKKITSYVDTTPERGLEFEAVEELMPWVGWLDPIYGGPDHLKVCVHPDQLLTRGRDGTIAAHEKMHSIQNAHREAEAADDLASPLAGLVMMHTPDIVTSEAGTQLAEFIALHPNWYNVFQAKYNELGTMVINNAHVMINNGHAEKEVLDYVTERLPFESEDFIKMYITARRDDPFWRIAAFPYEYALGLVRDARGFNKAQLSYLLPRITEQVLPAEDVTYLVNQAKFIG